MTRYKKELRKRGYMLEIDYPCMPYIIGSSMIISINTRIEFDKIVIFTITFDGYSIEFIDRKFNVVERAHT